MALSDSFAASREIEARDGRSTALIAATCYGTFRFSLARRKAWVDGSRPCRGKPNVCSPNVSTFADPSMGPVAPVDRAPAQHLRGAGRAEVNTFHTLDFGRATGGHHGLADEWPAPLRLLALRRAAFTVALLTRNFRSTWLALNLQAYATLDALERRLC